MEDEILLLKNASSRATTTVFLTNTENIIREVKERYQREKNVVMVRIRELHSENRETRYSHDKNEVLSIIHSIGKDIPSPKYIIRIGKYKLNLNRPVKVCFDSSYCYVKKTI